MSDTPVAECPHCLNPHASGAPICAACGCWAVKTRLTGTAELLRFVGYVWVVASLIGGAMLGFGKGPISGVAIGVAVALQGLLVGLFAVVIAEGGQRVPE